MNDTDDTELDSLRALVRQLVDQQAIRDLVSRLGVTLDEQRMDDLGDVYTDDVIFGDDPGERGLDALKAAGREAHDVFDRTQHIITDVLADLNGDRATVRANLFAIAVHHGDESESHRDLGAVYRFDAIRTRDGWRLASFRLDPVWTAGDDPLER